MSKLFIIQIIDILNRISMQNKSKLIDISTKVNTARIFKSLYKLGNDIYGYNFTKKLTNVKINDADDFRNLLMSDEFKDALKSDRQGMFLIKKIKFPSKADIAKEMEVIYNKYKNNMSKDSEDVDDPIHTYAIRTQDGDGPVVFVDGIKTEEGRREIRKWYAWTYKINYFKVRECSYEFWKKHPDRQEFSDKKRIHNYKLMQNDITDEELIESINIVNESVDDDSFGKRINKRRLIDNMKFKRFNKYHKFDDIENEFNDQDDDIDDFYLDNNDNINNESFIKGDNVERINSKNNQNFIVIDVLESIDDIEDAKRKRRYRMMLPKEFEISSETPALAVMTVKGFKGGLNFIYPASEFKHVN